MITTLLTTVMTTNVPGSMGGNSFGAIDLVLNSGPLAKMVLFLLLSMSIFSWAIIIIKYKNIQKAIKHSNDFLKVFWYGKDIEEIYIECEGMHDNPMANVFKAGFKEYKKIAIIVNKEMQSQQGTPPGTSPISFSKKAFSITEMDNIHRALRRTSMVEISALERYSTFLATAGSTAPFIGLFGTVWGIMNSFHNIGASGSANLAVVAPGISEALIATAAGLVVAIPSVIAYNYFVGKIRRLASNMEVFSQDFLNIMQRNLITMKDGK